MFRSSASASPKPAWASRLLLLIFALLSSLLFSPALSQLAAQTAAKRVDPENYDFDLPDSGLIRQGEGRKVQLMWPDDKGTPWQVVALVHVDVGDRRVVMLPDGRLVSVAMKDTTPTEKAFTPATKDAIANGMIAKDFAGFKTRSTAHYVYVYNTSEEFYTGTSRILESMYPGVYAYFKRQKFPVHDPRTPMVVIMFHDEEAYLKYHPMPPGVVAYYNGLSNHIVMYEHSKLSQVARDLAIKQAIATIAHEGVHQILHNIGVQQRLSRWPMWISEGLAEYFAPTTVNEKMKWKGVGTVNDMRMWELEKYFKQVQDTKGETVRKTVAAARLTSTGYASAWSLTHFLAFRYKDKFPSYVRDVSKAQPFQTPNLDAEGKPDNLNLFTKHFGSDMEAMERDLIKHLQRLDYVNPMLNR